MRTIEWTISGALRREEIRRLVIAKFLKELPGTGSGPLTSKYRYNVQQLSNGRWVYLTRPAYHYKGFDFLISVEGESFSNGKENPKHADILGDLASQKAENASKFASLKTALRRVYRCEDPADFVRDYTSLKFRKGRAVDLILMVTKWFFIEQDIRDWNYSGRAMLMNAIEKI